MLRHMAEGSHDDLTLTAAGIHDVAAVWVLLLVTRCCVDVGLSCGCGCCYGDMFVLYAL
jgi:hypothetical protein